MSLQVLPDPANVRQESDILGACDVDNTKLYGIHTLRALGNFSITGAPLGAEADFSVALATTKLAVAKANFALGLLPADIFNALEAACREMMAGQHLDHLVVDQCEGSGGTSTNMNINEVLTNRTLELLGQARGTYTAVSPHDHVNRSQSTSDVVQTAMRLAAYRKTTTLVTTLQQLADSLNAKAVAFAGILHLGRTCLQDALPMTLGQRFAAYAELVTRQIGILQHSQQQLLALPLGGTGIGSGLGAPAGYQALAIDAMCDITGLAFRSANNLFDTTQNMDAFSHLSGEIKTVALSIGKTSNDLMLLSSGPKGGMAEIALPERQAGSSMMPGKVNPVIPITFCQAAFIVAGNDVCISMAANQGHLENNSYESLIAARLFESFSVLTKATVLFRTLCIEGITANSALCETHLFESTAIASAFSATLGYKRVSELVRSSRKENISFIDILEREDVMKKEDAIKLIYAATNAAAIETHN